MLVDVLSNQWQQEKNWFENVNNKMSEAGDAKNVKLDLSWAAYHASKSKKTEEGSAAINSLLPLFHENSAIVSIIRHAMNVITTITSHINPNQIPVFCADQPALYIGQINIFSGIIPICAMNPSLSHFLLRCISNKHISGTIPSW